MCGGAAPLLLHDDSTHPSFSPSAFLVFTFCHLKQQRQTKLRLLPSTFVSQVKQIMEEAVTRKFVHADSSHIISFCGECLVN